MHPTLAALRSIAAVVAGYLIIAVGISSDPAWFDLGGATVLVAGGILGAWLVERWRGASPPASAAEARPRA